MSISNRTLWVKSVSALLIGFILGIALLQTASALYGSWTNFTAGTRGYRARSEVAISLLISQNKDIALGWAHLETTNGANAPAGHMGVKGYLYRYNGGNSYTLEGSSTLYFNPTARSKHAYGFDVTAVSGRTYAAEGYVEALNTQNSQYVTTNTSRTSNLSY